MRRRPTGIIVHGDTSNLEDTVTCRRSDTEAGIAITPMIPEPLAGHGGHVRRQHLRLHAVEIEDGLAWQPIHAVLVLCGLGVGWGGDEGAGFGGRPVGVEEVLGVGGALGERGG